MVTRVENYNSMKQLIATGDLILFHGPGPESELIEAIDHTPFSHVAMVVKLPRYDKPLLWTSDEIVTITDVLDDKRQKGVHLLDLASVLQFCNHKTAKSGARYTYTWRKLDYDKPKTFMQLLEKFMQHVDGTAFPSLEAMALHFFAGSLGISTGTKSMFCSELITDTFVHLNLLPPDTIINSYSPGSYADGQHVQLLNGATLSPEVAFTYAE
jgi:hypothetical protein